MKLEDIKVGMKVVPVRKSIYKSLEESIRVKRMGEIKQEFMYVIKVYGDGEISCNENIDNSGDLFLPADLEPYMGDAVTITLNVDSGKVTASMGEKKGVSFCNPTDAFNLSVGADIALTRMFDNDRKLEIGDIVKVIGTDNNTPKESLGTIGRVTNVGQFGYGDYIYVAFDKIMDNGCLHDNYFSYYPSDLQIIKRGFDGDFKEGDTVEIIGTRNNTPEYSLGKQGVVILADRTHLLVEFGSPMSNGVVFSSLFYYLREDVKFIKRGDK